MATVVAKYSRLCGTLLRSSNGWLLAQRPRILQSGYMVPLITFQNAFGVTSADDLFENYDEDENLFSSVILVVKGSDEAVLDSYSQFVTRAAKILNLDISRRTVLQTSFDKRTLLKSPHIFKKHRVQYEVRTHGRMLKLNKLTGDTADVFLEYIQRNLPEGVSMNVEQTEVVDVPEYIRPPILLTHETIAKKTTDSVAS